MTTHWIIGIGSPKLPVMSGKAILTAVSSGTTEIPSPTSTSRSHGEATAGAGAATPFTEVDIASSRYRGMQIEPLACCVALPGPTISRWGRQEEFRINGTRLLRYARNDSVG